MTVDKIDKNLGQLAYATANLRDKLGSKSKGEFFIITAAIISLVIFTNYRYLGELSSLQMREYGQDQIFFVKTNLANKLKQADTVDQQRQLLTFVQPVLARKGYILDWEITTIGSEDCANFTISSQRYQITDNVCP